jgi:hypothetical protein
MLWKVLSLIGSVVSEFTEIAERQYCHANYKFSK